MTTARTVLHRSAAWAGLDGGASQPVPWTAPALYLLVMTAAFSVYGRLVTATGWDDTHWPVVAPLVSGQLTVILFASRLRGRPWRRFVAACAGTAVLWAFPLVAGHAHHPWPVQFGISLAGALIGCGVFTAVVRRGFQHSAAVGAPDGGRSEDAEAR